MDFYWHLLAYEPAKVSGRTEKQRTQPREFWSDASKEANKSLPKLSANAWTYPKRSGEKSCFILTLVKGEELAESSSFLLMKRLVKSLMSDSVIKIFLARKN